MGSCVCVSLCCVSQACWWFVCVNVQEITSVSKQCHVLIDTQLLMFPLNWNPDTSNDKHVKTCRTSVGGAPYVLFYVLSVLPMYIMIGQ